MQQTVDADVDAKDQMDVDVTMVLDSVLETTLVSGSSYFFCSAAETVLVQDVEDADVTTVVSGLSSYYSAVADLAETAAVQTAVAVVATICAANC